MGMYDEFGPAGDQLKIFNVPCYYFNETEYLKIKAEKKFDSLCFLGFMGGALNHYAEGSYVPWRAMSYNFGKDFNALDYAIDEQKPYVYIFRDGKFVKQYEGEEECSEIYESMLEFPTYNKNGVLLSFYIPENVSMYFDTIKKHWEVLHILNIRTKSIHTALNRAFQSKIILPDEFNEAQIDIDWLEKIVAESYTKRKESDFYASDADDIYLSYYGAYLELVHNNKYDGLKREALMQEAKCFVLNHNVSLDMYFSWNETPEENRGWIKETDEFILNWPSQS